MKKKINMMKILFKDVCDRNDKRDEFECEMNGIIFVENLRDFCRHNLDIENVGLMFAEMVLLSKINNVSSQDFVKEIHIINNGIQQCEIEFQKRMMDVKNERN